LKGTNPLWTNCRRCGAY